MSTHRSPVRDAKQSRIVLVLLALALGASGWSAVHYISSAPVQAHIDQGVQFHNQGNDKDAEREWREAVGLDKDNAQAWELLGDLYLKELNFPAAKNAFDNVLRVAPGTPDLNVRRAIVAYQLRDNNEARTLAQSELKNNPNNVAALRVIANVEKGGHSDILLSALQRLVRLDPENVTTINALIDELHNRDAYDKIVPLADRVVKLAPRSADSYLRRGVALYIANPTPDSMARAKGDLQKALQLEPDNVEAHRYLARVYLRLNQPRLAIAEFQAVGKGRPYASAHLMELSQAYLRAGDVKLAEKTRARFISLRGLNAHWINVSDQIGREPNKAENYLALARLLVRQALGDDTDAYHLYSFQVGQGQLLSIQEYLDTAIRLSPKLPGIPATKQQVETVYDRYIVAGENAARSRNYALANENAAKALLIRPKDPRTSRLVQQVQKAGFDPSPHFEPDAVPDEHQR